MYEVTSVSAMLNTINMFTMLRKEPSAKSVIHQYSRRLPQFSTFLFKDDFACFFDSRYLPIVFVLRYCFAYLLSQ